MTNSSPHKTMCCDRGLRLMFLWLVPAIFFAAAPAFAQSASSATEADSVTVEYLAPLLSH